MSRRPTLALMLLLAILTASMAWGQAPLEDRDAHWPGEATPAGEQGEHTRYTFEVDGRAAWVVVPQHPAPGHPWVWRARFPGYHAEADAILLDRGFHIAFIDTNNMLGSPRAMAHWDAFYAFTTEHGLAARPAIEAVSRGGLFAYAFAARWPERVACIYADTPVCDIKSWPGGKGTGRGHDATWQNLLKQYDFTESQAIAYRKNPIDILAPIAEAKIPLLHIVSLNDEIVPPTENTFVLAERYRALGGQIDLMQVQMGTSQSGGHHFDHPDPVRVADFIERHATALPGDKDYFVMRGSLDNARIRFERDKVGKVVFVGGSITNMPDGWREMTAKYLQQRFADTDFTFVNAGIPSTGSVPGAFRLMRDAFSDGPPDLIFEEAAVNDLHNMRTDAQMTRGMEGILRHARKANPNVDLVVMHFVDPRHMDDYRNGQTPNVIAHHEPVADYYAVPTLHLAREVTERIDAGQFDWARDFKDLHPSAYGHRLYTASIRRLLATAWEAPLSKDAMPTPHPLPVALIDPFSYDAGQLLSPDRASALTGFELVEKCDPTAQGVGGGVRGGFVNVPMLVGDGPGDTFSFAFTGRSVGLFVAAGPDAGVIEYRIDEGPWKKQDLFTKWSGGLHLPWAYVLADELEPGEHTLNVRISADQNDKSKGHAVRIVHFLTND